MQNLGIIVIAAAVMVMAGRVVRMPAIVVYLLAGILIGPLLGWVEMSPALDLISEKGIALLLFLVGLELSFDKIRDVGKVAIAAGIGQVVFTAAGGYVLCWLLGFPVMDALFLATALTFSSTVVVVKLLDEKGELDSLYGRIAVGIFLVQDLVVIVILTFLAGLEGGVDAFKVTAGLLKAFGGMAALLAVSLLASRYILPRPFAWAARSPEVLLVWALSWCFLLVLAAHAFGLSLEVGAFLAGLGLAQLPCNDDLRRRVHPLMNMFIAVFFVSLGVRMEAGGAAANWWPTLVLSLFVLIGNPFIFMIIIRRMGYDKSTSFLTSVTVAQISEFSFIFAGMGLSRGLIGAEILSITALVGVVTIAVSAYMILYNRPLLEWCDKSGILDWRVFAPGRRAKTPGRSAHGLSLSGHVIVVGMNTLGRRIARGLHERGETVLAVDTDPAKLRDLPVHTLTGSVEYLSVLKDAGIDRARLLVSALRIEETNDLLAYRCQSAGIPSAVHVVDLSVVDNLLDLGTDYMMIPKVDGVKAQLKILREMKILKS
ncbi:MAG: cation:proton antiporter [Akkermansiaceae bacterium]|nr:cation:proton antiporter [Akkermansiaceae bacterium]